MTRHGTPRRRWRCWRFTLRGLLLFIAILSVWLGSITHRARTQKQAVDAIQRLGGHVRYDYQQYAPPTAPSTDPKPDRRWHKYNYTKRIAELLAEEAAYTPPGPEWLRALVGDDYFTSVVTVSLSGAAVTNDVLAHVGRLSSVTTLHLNSTAVDDEGIRRLAALAKLEELRLSHTRATGASLKFLQRSAGTLKRLFLDRTALSDQDLEHIRRFHNLEYLSLTGTSITDGAVAHLAQLTRLRRLDLYCCRISEGAVSDLRRKLPDTEINWSPYSSALD